MTHVKYIGSITQTFARTKVSCMWIWSLLWKSCRPRCTSLWNMWRQG